MGRVTVAALRKRERQRGRRASVRAHNTRELPSRRPAMHVTRLPQPRAAAAAAVRRGAPAGARAARRPAPAGRRAPFASVNRTVVSGR